MTAAGGVKHHGRWSPDVLGPTSERGGEEDRRKEGRWEREKMFELNAHGQNLRMRMMEVALRYLSSHWVRGRLVGGEEGTGQLRLIGERRWSRGGEVTADPRSPRTAEVREASRLTGIGRS